jgi:ATP-dependent protease ClpP protease subunit
MKELIFSGDVNSVSVRELMGKILEIDPQEEIILYISSGGGFMSAAMMFYEFIKARNVNLTTVGLGSVSSAALVLILSGKKRKATSRTRFLMHPIVDSTSLFRRILRRLSPRESRENKAVDALFNTKCQAIFSREIKLSSVEIKKYLTREHLLMGAQEALSAGFIHEIID